MIVQIVKIVKTDAHARDAAGTGPTSRFYGWDDSVAARGFLLYTSRMLIETHDAKRKYTRR